AAVIDPALGGPLTKISPDRLRIPVFFLLGNEVAALEDQDAGGRRRKGVRDRSAAGAATNNNDVETLVHSDRSPTRLRQATAGPPSLVIFASAGGKVGPTAPPSRS